MRFRWLLVGWTGLAIAGWLISADIWADREARCDPSYSLICFSRGDIWVVTGAFTGGIWLLGVLVLAVAGLCARAWAQRRGR